MDSISLPGVQQFDLNGHVAIITGGSRGLGSAMAAGLASAGAIVVLAGRNGELAAEVAQEITDTFGHPATGIATDVTSPADVKALVAETIKTYGKVDILINSAGVNIRGGIDEVSYEDFQQASLLYSEKYHHRQQLWRLSFDDYISWIVKFAIYEHESVNTMKYIYTIKRRAKSSRSTIAVR